MTTYDFNDDDTAKRLLKALGAEVATFCEMAGLKHLVQPFAVRNDGNEIVLQIRLVAEEQPDEDALSAEGGMYLDACHAFRLKAKWLYSTFREGRHAYEVWGLVPTPDGDDALVLVRRDDGILYAYPCDVVRQHMLDREIADEGGAS